MPGAMAVDMHTDVAIELLPLCGYNTRRLHDFFSLSKSFFTGSVWIDKIRYYFNHIIWCILSEAKEALCRIGIWPKNKTRSVFPGYFAEHPSFAFTHFLVTVFDKFYHQFIASGPSVIMLADEKEF